MTSTTNTLIFASPVSLKIGICKSSWTQNDAAQNLGRFIVQLTGGVHRRTPQRNGKKCNPQQERADADSLADAQHWRRRIRRGQERYNACDSVTSDAIDEAEPSVECRSSEPHGSEHQDEQHVRGHNVHWHRSVATEVQRE